MKDKIDNFSDIPQPIDSMPNSPNKPKRTIPTIILIVTMVIFAGIAMYSGTQKYLGQKKISQTLASVGDPTRECDGDHPCKSPRLCNEPQGARHLCVKPYSVPLGGVCGRAEVCWTAPGRNIGCDNWKCTDRDATVISTPTPTPTSTSAPPISTTQCNIQSADSNCPTWLGYNWSCMSRPSTGCPPSGNASYTWDYAGACCCECKAGSGGCEINYNPSKFTATQGSIVARGTTTANSAISVEVNNTDTITFNARDLLTTNVAATSKWKFLLNGSPLKNPSHLTNGWQEIKEKTNNSWRDKGAVHGSSCNNRTNCVYSDCEENVWNTNICNDNQGGHTGGCEDSSNACCTKECSIYDTTGDGIITINPSAIFLNGVTSATIQAIALTSCLHSERSAYVNLVLPPQATPTPTASPVTGLTYQCSQTQWGWGVTYNWNSVSGATYAVRGSDITSGWHWNGDCSNPYQGDFCNNNLTNNNFQHIVGNKTYVFWMHVIVNNNWSTPVTLPQVKCPKN